MDIQGEFPVKCPAARLFLVPNPILYLCIYARKCQPIRERIHGEGSKEELIELCL